MDKYAFRVELNSKHFECLDHHIYLHIPQFYPVMRGNIYIYIITKNCCLKKLARIGSKFIIVSMKNNT